MTPKERLEIELGNLASKASRQGVGFHYNIVFEAKKAILDLFKEMIPEAKDLYTPTQQMYFEANAYNVCRTELLKRIEEMGR